MVGGRWSVVGGRWFHLLALTWWMIDGQFLFWFLVGCQLFLGWWSVIFLGRWSVVCGKKMIKQNCGK